MRIKAYEVTMTLIVNILDNIEGPARLVALHEAFKERCALGREDDIDSYNILNPDPNDVDDPYNYYPDDEDEDGCADCGRPCKYEKDENGFHKDQGDDDEDEDDEAEHGTDDDGEPTCKACECLLDLVGGRWFCPRTDCEAFGKAVQLSIPPTT